MNILNNIQQQIKSKLSNWSGIEVYLILSTGRTGTEFFAHFFNDILNNAIALHEPNPDAFDLGVALKRNLVDDKKALNIFKSDRYSILQTLKKEKKNIYIESNNNLVLLIPILKKVFPNMKIIHIERKAEDYVRSAISKEHGFGYTFHGEKDPRARLTAKDFDKDPFNLKWDKFTQFEKVTWHWKKYNSLIENTNWDDSKYIKLSFEKIFFEEHQDLKRLFKFMNLPDNIFLESLNKLNNKKNHSSKYIINVASSWSNQDKINFETIINSKI
ncbi:sulfotransferase domain-containing protein [Flammeovirga pacifica]|nr:sulfotransferase domain-containing protein [Flammeovirga pacifica]